IPATFVSPHAYAGTMVISLPWLVGAWVQPGLRGWQRGLLAAAAAAALLGNFLSATRVNLGILAVLLVIVTFSGKLRGAFWAGWLLMLAGVGYLVSSEERLQRFLTLRDTEEVVGRIGGSVNKGFLELAGNYPMGNGMGGGGTSIPFFL